MYASTVTCIFFFNQEWEMDLPLCFCLYSLRENHLCYGECSIFHFFLFTHVNRAVNFIGSFAFVLVPERHEAYRLLLQTPSYFFSSDCRWNAGAILAASNWLYLCFDLLLSTSLYALLVVKTLIVFTFCKTLLANVCLL